MRERNSRLLGKDKSTKRWCIMAGFLTFSILFALNQMLSRGAEAQQCPAFGSEQSIYGWMLQRHIYKTMMADLGLDCLLVCRKDDRCQSFNFAMSLHMCEFSDRTKEARPEDFIPDPDRYYFRRDIKRVPLGSIPELAATSCKEIKASEGEDISAKYWLSTIKPNVAVLAYCDMKTEDVDECTASHPVCDINAICNNTIGSYKCSCKPGYSGNGRTCQDTDECATNIHRCDANAVCNNTKGSYICTCRPGYSGDGKSCADIDECASGVHDCHGYASCTNTQGSFSCSCNYGFIGSGKNCNASECQSYTSLTSADRKITYTTNRYYCDNSIGPAWFRFQGAAGSRMVSSCSPTYRCNTHVTGWLTGGHPTVADGQVSRTVCFHYSNHCCYWSTTIKVRNCGPFYVYYLSGTPTCNLRYCGTD